MAYKYSQSDIDAELARRQSSAAPTTQSFEYSQADIDAEIAKRQPKMSMGEEYRSRGEEYFINNTSSKYLPFISDKKLQENIRNASSDPQGKAAFTTVTNPFGFGDEIKAGIAAGVAKLFGGAATKDIDIGDLYREARIAERSLLDKARQDQPTMTGMIETPSNLARGAIKGLEETGSGIYQAAADFGADFSGAKAILSKIRPDLKNEIESLTAQDISGILGEKAAQDSKGIEQEGLAYKTGRFAGKVAPFVGIGGASPTGLAIGGAASGASELMEDSSATKRLGSTAIGAVAAPVIGKVIKEAVPAAQSAVGAISQAPKKLLQKITGIDPKAVKTFQDLGIDPTLADVSKSAGLQNFIKDIPVAGKPITEALQKQVNDISGQIQNVVSVKPKTYARTGKMIKEGAEEFEKFAGQRVSGLYDDLDRQILNETQEMTSGKLSSAIDEWVKLKDLQSELVQSVRGNSKAAALVGGSPKYSNEYKSLLDLGNELKSSVKGNSKIASLINEDASQKLGFWRNKARAKSSEFLTKAADDARSLNNVNKQISNEAKNLKPGNTEFLTKAAEDAKNLNNVNKQISKQLGLISNYEKYLSPSQLQSVLATGEVTVPTRNISKIINDSQVQDIAAVGSGDTARVISRYKNIIDESGNMSYPRLKSFRTTIGAKLQSPSLLGDERLALKKIYGGLSEDMKDSVALYGGTKGLQAFDKANAAFKRKTEFIENIIEPVIKAKTVTKAYKKAISPLKEDATIAKNLMSSLKPIQQEYVRASIVRDMGLARKGTQSAEGDVFSPQKFMAEYSVLKKNGSEKAIFTPEQVTAFNRLNKAVELTKNTEQAGKSNKMLQMVGLGTVGYGTGPVGLAASVGIGRAISSKLMANPKFINWLAVTSQATPKELPKQLNRLSAITAANPEIREDVLNLVANFGASDAEASEPNLSEEQIRQQMLDSNQQDIRQGLPPVYTEEDLQNNPSKIKKRYYR